MELQAADQICAHMIYPAFLKAGVLRNIQTSLCLHMSACVWTCSLVILQACIHTHAQSPEAKQYKVLEAKSLAGVSLLHVPLSLSLSLCLI